MTTVEAVETSVTTTNSLSQDYTNLDDHISQTSIDVLLSSNHLLFYSLLLLFCCRQKVGDFDDVDDVREFASLYELST